MDRTRLKEQYRDPDSYLSTLDVERDLKNSSVRGGIATVSAQGVGILLSLTAMIVLARLLSPADFGLVAMVTALIGFLAIFNDAGLSIATVQRERISHVQVSTLFWINTALGLVLSVAALALAPVVAWFYGEPVLTSVTMVVGCAFTFSGLTVQHQAILRRQMRFHLLAASDITARAIGVSGGILSAYLGAQYWALVVMILTTTGANMVLAWIFCDWRPGRPKFDSSVRPLVAFGGNLAANSFLVYATRTIDNALIGRVWGAEALGLYTRAYQLLLLPINQINAPITATAIPALSRLQNEPERFRAYYRKGLSYITFLGMPICAFALVASTEIIDIVLGPGWTEVAPIFRALGVAALFGTFNVALGWALIPLGRAKRLLKVNLFGSTVIICSFFIGIAWGVEGVAFAFSAGTVVSRIPQLAYAYSGNIVGMTDFWRAIWRPLTSSLLAASGTFILRAESVLSLDNDILTLLLLVSVYGILYVVIFGAMPGGIVWLRNAFSDVRLGITQKTKRT